MKPSETENPIRTSLSKKEALMDTATTTSDVICSDKVEGTAVYNNSGDKLGSIDSLMIDKRSGHVRYGVLEFGGFLGLGGREAGTPAGR